MILNEDLFEIDATIAPETSDETPTTPEDNGIANQIITEINGEWDTIKSYNDLVLCLKELGRDDFVDVIQDIIKEENVHVGQLQEILKVISTNANSIATGETEANGQLNESDLHPRFKNKAKKEYKQWDKENDKTQKNRDELYDLIGSSDKKAQELVDKVYPSSEKYKMDVNPGIEIHDYPFYVSYYEEYPIYEPAEGGYYYAGNNAVYSSGFNTEAEAKEFMDEYVKSSIESGENWETYGKRGYYIPSKYIGEQSYIILEPNKEYLSRVSGYEPYN